MGSLQIQNRGTIAGNLCNASPAADGVPPLLALDASVEITSASGIRVLPLSSFITGYRSTALRAGELVSAIIVPKPAASARSAFVKLGARKYLVISILMAAAVIEQDAEGRISKAAVAVGAASPVAQRLPALERALVGLVPEQSLATHVRKEHLAPLSPIDDVRATGTIGLKQHSASLARRSTAPQDWRARECSLELPAEWRRRQHRGVTCSAPDGCVAPHAAPDRNQDRLRRGRLRRLHRPHRWRSRLRLPCARRSARRRQGRDR